MAKGLPLVLVRPGVYKGVKVPQLRLHRLVMGIQQTVRQQMPNCLAKSAILHEGSEGGQESVVRQAPLLVSKGGRSSSTLPGFGWGSLRLVSLPKGIEAHIAK